jgi:hypothetical protein
MAKLLLFIFLVYVLYLLSLFILNNKAISNFGITLILLAISINLDLGVFIHHGQKIYLHIFCLVISVITFLIIQYYLIIRGRHYYKAEVTLNKNFHKHFYFLLFAFLFIILLLLIQYNLVRIYDLNLFIHHLMVYLSITLLLIWFYLTFILSGQKQNNDIIFKSIVVLSLLNSILSILQFIFNRSFLLSNPAANINYYEGIKVVKRVWGIVGASNGAGNLGAILFAVLLYYLYKKKNIFIFLVFVLNFVFILLTLTRIAYLAIFIEFLIFCLFIFVRNINYKTIIVRVALTNLGVIILFLSIYFFFDDAYKLLVLDRGSTESHRFIQFSNITKLLKDIPMLGIGAGQYVYYVYTNYGIRDIVIHSQFLNILVEQGFISFITYLFIYIYMLIVLIKKFKKDVWFPISLFVGNFITSNFNPNQYYNVTIYIFMFISLGLIFFRNNTMENQNVNEPRS